MYVIYVHRSGVGITHRHITFKSRPIIIGRLLLINASLIMKIKL
jgi:hypothetical protein